MWCDFGPIGQSDILKPHGAQQDRIGLLHLVHSFLGDIYPLFQEIFGTGINVFQIQLKPSHFSLNRIQNLYAG